jgi:transposase-like protein
MDRWCCEGEKCPQNQLWTQPRRWPEAVKREIVAASNAPGSSVSIVARRYDVNANQVFKWRKLLATIRVREPVPRSLS